MIYLDNAATTYISRSVVQAMLPSLSGLYANPSSPHRMGLHARNLIEDYRCNIADLLKVKCNEIYFTASGTEANNIAVKGIAKANKNKGNHIITTKIEHHSILHSCQQLEQEGFIVTYLNVDKHGMIALDELEQAITSSTILITIMYANNEIGTIQPIEEISKIAACHNIYFHTDAVQAMCHTEISTTNITSLSFAAHKFHGPKGIGCLYLKQNTPIYPILTGGAQEQSLRPGTENITQIAGLSCALEDGIINLKKNTNRMYKLRDYFLNKLKQNIPSIELNGHPTNRLCNNINILFPTIDAATLLIMLDAQHICVSTGSACTSQSSEPSHVLTAIGLSEQDANSSIRFSISHNTTTEELDEAIQILTATIPLLSC